MPASDVCLINEKVCKMQEWRKKASVEGRKGDGSLKQILQKPLDTHTHKGKRYVRRSEKKRERERQADREERLADADGSCSMFKNSLNLESTSITRQAGEVNTSIEPVRTTSAADSRVIREWQHCNKIMSILFDNLVFKGNEKAMHKKARTPSGPNKHWSSPGDSLTVRIFCHQHFGINLKAFQTTPYLFGFTLNRIECV